MKRKYYICIKGIQVLIFIFTVLILSNRPAYANEITEIAQTEENTEIKLFSGGEGTRENPFLISSTSDLVALTESYPENSKIRDACFKVTKNLSLKKVVWQPIGNQEWSFSGVFDGNGKTITMDKISTVSTLGFFGVADQRSVIENLTIKATITKKLSSKNDVYCGIIAGIAEGAINNCITEGKVTYTVNTSKECYIGGIVGFGRGELNNNRNDAVLSLSRSGKGYTAIGGIAGSMRGNTNRLSQFTNTGTIEVNTDGSINAGGIVGEYEGDKKLNNVKNQGNLSVMITKAAENQRYAAGGITGVLMRARIDRALNQGKVWISSKGNADRVEIIAGGITGIAEASTLTNVGNEGSIEARENKIIYAAGIVGNIGRGVKINNAYNQGNIYGESPDPDSELYVAGMIEGIAEVNNFYNSGSVRLKGGSRNGIGGEAFTNIRPGENTDTFQYGYWATGYLPFPLLQKAQPTSSEFNPQNGKLARSISIKNKKYGSIKDALNAWVATQKSGYLLWTGKKTPVFKEYFGFVEKVS